MEIMNLFTFIFLKRFFVPRMPETDFPYGPEMFLFILGKVKNVCGQWFLKRKALLCYNLSKYPSTYIIIYPPEDFY